MTKIEKQQMALRNAILECMMKQNVAPNNVLEVLAGGCVHALVPLAVPLGYEEKEITKVFAEGLLNAKIEFNDEN